MLNFGSSEILILLLLIVIFIGPKRLPEIARSLGRMVKQFKQASKEISDSLEVEENSEEEEKDLAQR